MPRSTLRATAVLAAAGLLLGSAVPARAGEGDPAAPAAVAPASPATDGSDVLEALVDARRDVLQAHRLWVEASAAHARARHEEAGTESLGLLERREQAAREALDQARRRVPEVVARARAAGISTAVLRQYEHALYGR